MKNVITLTLALLFFSPAFAQIIDQDGKLAANKKKKNLEGKIGIGNPNFANAVAPLSFSNIMGSKIDLYFDEDGGNRFGFQTQDQELRIHSGISGDITFGNLSTELNSSFTENFRFTYTGKLGIGTADPNFELDVAGSINATEYLLNGQPLSTGGSSLWSKNGSSIFYNQGKVAIGTDDVSDDTSEATFNILGNRANASRNQIIAAAITANRVVGAPQSMIALKSTSRHNTSDTVGFLTGSVSQAVIDGGNSVGISGSVLGAAQTSTIDNPLERVTFARGAHTSLELLRGILHAPNTVQYLDIDIDQNNLNSGSLNIMHDVTYLSGDSGNDFLKQYLENRGRKLRFIHFKGTAESDFNGIINYLGDVSTIENASDKVLINKEYLNRRLDDLGTGGKFVNGDDPSDAVYVGGNVGIGNTSPEKTLDVDGDIRGASVLAQSLLLAGTETTEMGAKIYQNHEETLSGNVANEYTELNRTENSEGGSTFYYGKLLNVTNSSNDDDGGTRGIDINVNKTGTSSTLATYGLDVDTNISAGTTDFGIGIANRLLVDGTNRVVFDQIVRGIDVDVRYFNPNATTPFLQGQHLTLDIRGGEIQGDTDLLFLDYDISSFGNLVSGGDWSFINGGAGTDVENTKNWLANQGKKFRYIWNQSTLESDFNGIINYIGDVSTIENATNKVLINKEYLNTRLDAVDSWVVTGENNDNIYYNEGNVGIGIDNPQDSDALLSVGGKILSTEVEVVSIDSFPDYVFEKYYTGSSTLKEDYDLPTLAEVEAYTRKNHHLPAVPSAAQVKENGMELKEMTTILLQKIEELTLYTIEQEKALAKERKKNNDLDDRLKKLEAIVMKQD